MIAMMWNCVRCYEALHQGCCMLLLCNFRQIFCEILCFVLCDTFGIRCTVLGLTGMLMIIVAMLVEVDYRVLGEIPLFAAAHPLNIMAAPFARDILIAGALTFGVFLLIAVDHMRRYQESLICSLDRLHHEKRWSRLSSSQKKICDLSPSSRKTMPSIVFIAQNCAISAYRLHREKLCSLSYRL